MNRPPPYFPQNQLSPPDEKRYRNFKLVVGAILFIVTLSIIGIGIALYYAVSWFFAS